MEFKDATSAAQAAAESAERASMAARAAAQLSSQGKITRQYSTESHKSNIRDERPPVTAPTEFPGQHHFRDSYSNSFNDKKSKIQNQQMDLNEHDTSTKTTESFYGDSHGGNKRSSNGLVEEDSLVNNFGQADGHFQKSSLEDKGPLYSETGTKKEFKESKAELGGGRVESFKSEDINYFAEEAIGKQPSMGSSHSHSSTIGDELDVSTLGQQKFGQRTGVGNPFAVVDHGNLFQEFTKDDTSKDDEADSDDNGPRFDIGYEYDEGEDKSYLESRIRPLENTHIWSPRSNASDTVDQVSSRSHLFSERHSFSERSAKSVDPLETDDHMHVNFDLSEGPDSESENELAKSPPKQDVESSQKVNSRKSRIELNDLVEKESSFHELEDDEESLQSRQSSRHEAKNDDIDRKSYDTAEDNNDFQSQSDDLRTGTGLNFGTLTGGLRNKGGLRYPPPYTKSTSTDTSLSTKTSVGESSVPVDLTSPRSFVKSSASRLENEKPSVSVSSSESDSDDYSDKFPVKSSQKAGKQAKTKLLFSRPVAFFNDESDSEEEVPVPPVRKQTFTNRAHLGSGLSRRTKGHMEPVAKTVISSSNDTNPRGYSHPSESPDDPMSYTRRFKKEDHKQKPESPISKREESPPEPWAFKQEANKTMSEPKATSNTSNPSFETSSGANMVKKPSYVHPKLPDYDSLAARLESIRANRQ